jgi:hypothetical protein
VHREALLICIIMSLQSSEVSSCALTGSGISTLREMRGLRTGLLVTLVTGEPVLGITHYFGAGHRGLAKKIQDEYGPIARVRWGGELEISDNQIIRANHTSGFANESVGQGNSAIHLLEFLNEFAPEFRGRWLFPEVYDPHHRHFLQALNDLVQNHNNFRHGFRNVLAIKNLFTKFGQEFYWPDDINQPNILQKVKVFTAVLELLYVQGDVSKQDLYLLPFLEMLLVRAKRGKMVPSLQELKFIHDVMSKVESVLEGNPEQSFLLIKP